MYRRHPVTLLLLFTLALVAGFFLTFARAQVIDPSSGLSYPDPRTLGSSWISLGLLVLTAISSLKRAAGRRWGEDVAGWPAIYRNAWTWYGIALGLGIASAFLLSGMKYGAELTFQGLIYPWSVVSFGALAGVVGAGGWDTLKRFGEVIARGNPSPAPTMQAKPPPLEPAALQAHALFDAGALGSVLSNGLLEAAIRMALRAAGLPAGSMEILAVAVQLGPDLLDGNLMLSTEHLNAINAAVLDLKAKYLSP